MRLTGRVYRSVVNRLGELTKKYANLPDAYIERASQTIEYKTPNDRRYLPRTISKKNLRFTTYRPWTEEATRQNERLGPRSKLPFVQPIRDWNFFKGDRVQVLTGDDKGKTGIISQVIQERNWVIVAGMNCHYKKMGETKGFPGTMMKWEKPLLVTSQVSLVDPTDNKPTTIEWRYTEDGERVRVSKRTGRVIPMPLAAEETYDYKSKKSYLESDKDTKAEVVESVTFAPKLKTFEMEVMEAMGITEDRIPKKSYWY